MPIIPHKEIFDDSKSVFTELRKDLTKINKQVKTLSKSSKELADALELVKKSNDGKEAEALAKGTDKLTKATKKLKKAKSDEQIVAEKLVKEHKKLNQTYTPQAKALAILRQRTLQQNKALREQAKAQLGVKKSSNGLIASFKTMGKQLAGGLGIAAAIGLVVAQFNKMVQRSKELNKLTRQLKGTFDITTREAKKLSAQISAMAENFEDVDAKSLQISLVAVVNTFKELSEQEALDLIREGFQKGSNNSGEFLDILREYPGFFKKAGLSASEMFAIINQQVKEGVYSDKGVDAIKEATISLTENTKIVKDALRPLGESVNLQIRQKVEAGKAFEAMQLISREMVTLGANSAEAQTIMADVFKGAGEDSEVFVRNLHNVSLSLEGVAKQTSVVGESTFNLSVKYNGFIQSVSDGNGIISRAFAALGDHIAGIFEGLTNFNEGGFVTKMKTIANGLATVTGVSEKYRFEIKEETEALKLAAIEHGKNTRFIKETIIAEETAAEKTKRLREEKKRLTENTKALAAAEKARQDQLRSNQTVLSNQIKLEKELADQLAKDLDIDEELFDAQSAIDNEQAIIDGKAKVQDKGREDELKKIEEQEERKQALVLGFLDATNTLASGIANAFAEEKQARIEERAERDKQAAQDQADLDKEAAQNIADTEIAILQDQLNKGIISKEEFATQSALINEESAAKSALINQSLADQISAIEKKQRQDSAKAERNSALFAIAINTAVAIIKAFAQLGPVAGAAAAIGIGLAAAAQAAIVLATPVKFADGGEVHGPGTSKSDSIPARLSNGEFVVNSAGYSSAPDIINAVNDGILSDRNAKGMLNKQDNNMLLAGLLMQNNKNSSEMVTLLGRLGIVYTKDGMQVIERAGTGKEFNLG